jgi:hypothetical protein
VEYTECLFQSEGDAPAFPTQGLQLARRTTVYANVLTFSPPREGQTLTDIPTPLFYRPGDRYTRVNVTDESTAALGLYPGAVLIFLANFRQDGGIHLFTRDGEPEVARLERCGRMFYMIYEGNHLPAPEVEVYGALAELYAVGFTGPRSVIYREDRARLMAPRHPELGMEIRLVGASSH